MVCGVIAREQGNGTHQFRTLALTLFPSSFSAMLCSISENISSWSVTYSGAPVAHPLATASPTSPPPAPSSNLYSRGAVALSVSWGSSTSRGCPLRATGEQGEGARAIRVRPPGRCRVVARHAGPAHPARRPLLCSPSSLRCRCRCSLCCRIRSHHPTFLSHARGGVQPNPGTGQSQLQLKKQ